MKNLLLTFNVLFMLLLPNMASAKDFVVNNIAYDVISMTDLTCEVAQNDSYSSYCNIPATVTFKGRTFKVIGIGENAFKSSWVQGVTIPEGIEYIHDEAFYICGLKEFTIPSSVITIGELAFYANKIENLTIADSDEMLEGEIGSTGWCPFYNNNIKKLYLGRNTNNKVLNDALHFSLEDFTIGDKVTELTWECFIPFEYFELIKLKKLVIGSGLRTVPFFNEGDNLTEIYVRATTPQKSEGFNDGTYMHATLFVPKGTKALYESADIWQNFWSIEEYDDTTTGITNVENRNDTATEAYDLTGRKIKDSEKGIVIKNGKKYLNK